MIILTNVHFFHSENIYYRNIKFYLNINSKKYVFYHSKNG